MQASRCGRPGARRRRVRVAAVGVGSAVAALLLAAVADAQPPTFGFGTNAPGDVGAVAAAPATGNATEKSWRWDGGGGGGPGGGSRGGPPSFLSEGETRLMWQAAFSGGAVGGGGGPFMWGNESAACDGGPFLMAQDSDATPNGACPARLTSMNASCTCLDGVTADASRVEFRVRRKDEGSADDVSSMPVSQRITEVLDLTTVASFSVPSTLQSLAIIGETTPQDDKPLALAIGQGFRWGNQGSESALLRNKEGSTITSITLANIDLQNVSTSDGFFPVSVTNLTLRNCNISGFNSPFIKPLDNLVSLDLSWNNLKEPYERPQVLRCSNGLCMLKSLNLSHNHFTSLPAFAGFFDYLEELYVQGNALTNVTVSPEVFAAISRLRVFAADLPTAEAAAATASTCSNGSVQTAHRFAFCVTGGAPSGASTADTTTDSTATTNSYLLYAVIGGCVIVAVLLFAVVRQRRGSHGGAHGDHIFVRRGTHGSKHDEYSTSTGNTYQFDESHLTSATANLLNDPIIITRRVPYESIRVATCINKGGFGVVYSGVYRRRRVAIKKIRADRSGDPTMVETFLREICLMATLRHARIVEFVGVAWDSSLRNLCAVTELMDKGDLRDVLQSFRKRNKPLAWGQGGPKTQIALHIAEALEYLHSLEPKVIHRDLKSKNVLLNAQLEAKLSDFGISRERRVEETHMTAAVGTSFWIAPEVLLGKDYDERADIYSFGIVLCEIDTDDYPFWNAKNNAAGGTKVQENAILRLVAAGGLRPEFSETCPKPILSVADLCLQTDPEDRPTAQQLVYLLQQVMHARGESSLSSTTLLETRTDSNTS